MAHELGIAEIRSFLDTAKTSDSLELKLYKVGSLIFAYGREQRALVLNPFDDIDRPEVAYTVPEILEPAKFKQLLARAEEEVPELIPFLAMAGFAGLRRSELVREYAEDQVLRWEDTHRRSSLLTWAAQEASGRNFIPQCDLTRYCNGTRVYLCKGATVCQKPCWLFSQHPAESGIAVL